MYNVETIHFTDIYFKKQSAEREREREREPRTEREKDGKRNTERERDIAIPFICTHPVEFEINDDCHLYRHKD